MSRVVKVRTPCRLHFGLSSLGGSERQYGGVGLMIDGVGVELCLSEATHLSVVGLHRERVQQFLQSSARQHQSLPSCRMEVIAAPPDHVGLGIGTQLGLGVATALLTWNHDQWRDAELLCRLSGRGNRSAIGTYGFLHGGLIIDGGKLPHESLGRLDERVQVPSDWRFVLVRQPSTHGLSGHAEATAMSSLPAVPTEVSRTLHRIISDRLLPAVRASDFEAFGSAVYEYGYRAGECFASAQGGPFASPEIAALVDRVRVLGYAGVGQSSWGPTVFVAAANQKDAERLVERLRDINTYANWHYEITQANNSGAIVEDVDLSRS